MNYFYDETTHDNSSINIKIFFGSHVEWNVVNMINTHFVCISLTKERRCTHPNRIVQHCNVEIIEVAFGSVCGDIQRRNDFISYANVCTTNLIPFSQFDVRPMY